MGCYIYNSPEHGLFISKNKIISHPILLKPAPTLLGYAETDKDAWKLLSPYIEPYKRISLSDRNFPEETSQILNSETKHYSLSKITRMIYSCFDFPCKPIYVCLYAKRKEYDNYILVQYDLSGTYIEPRLHLNLNLCPNESSVHDILGEMCEALEEPDMNTLTFVEKHEFDDKIVYFYTCLEDDSDGTEYWNDTVYYEDGRWFGYVDISKTNLPENDNKILNYIMEVLKNGKT